MAGFPGFWFGIVVVALEQSAGPFVKPGREAPAPGAGAETGPDDFLKFR
jgi:hypothetical protein